MMEISSPCRLLTDAGLKALRRECLIYASARVLSASAARPRNAVRDEWAAPLGLRDVFRPRETPRKVFSKRNAEPPFRSAPLQNFNGNRLGRLEARLCREARIHFRKGEIMETNVSVATISASASIMAAAISYFLTKSLERQKDWRNQKLRYYAELVAATSGVVAGDETPDSQRRFTTACNTIGLVASQKVINCLNEFREALWVPPDPPDAHERKFIALLREIRSDLRILPKDDPATFAYHL
jgi:hypothetical protein